MAKSDVSLAFANKSSFLSASNRRQLYTLFYIYLLALTKKPRKRRLIAAKARTACRNEHFFSPQGAALLSACRRILVLIPEKFRPKDRILPCFFPHDFLFEAKKALPTEKQKESGKPWRLTRSAPSGARAFPTACTCQATTASR